jgi:hypothetical protein
LIILKSVKINSELITKPYNKSRKFENKLDMKLEKEIFSDIWRFSVNKSNNAEVEKMKKISENLEDANM